MLSYKKWRDSRPLITESIGQTFALGVGRPQSIGTVGGTGVSGETTEKSDLSATLDEIQQFLDEAKKKCKCSKMDGDCCDEKPVDEPKDKPEVDAGDEGDDEVEDKADDKADDKGDEPEEKPEEKPEPTLFQKKQKKGMKKEETDFWASIHRQLSGGLPGQKYSDGLTEDSLVAPTDPNVGLADMTPPVPENPAAGEVGFAPQGKIGD